MEREQSASSKSDEFSRIEVSRPGAVYSSTAAVSDTSSFGNMSTDESASSSSNSTTYDDSASAGNRHGRSGFNTPLLGKQTTNPVFE